MRVKESRRRVRVGAIVLISGFAFAAILLAIKGQASLLGRTVTLDANFDDVAGLVPGAAVRLAGMHIGEVDDVRLPSDSKRVNVKMKIDRTYLERIRSDSIAMITTRGLLGDPLIEISLGSTAAVALEDGARLQSRAPRGLKEVARTLESMFDEDLAKDVHRITRSWAEISEGVASGPGLAHDLIYDRELSLETKATLASARRAISRLEGAVETADRILAEVETGNGFAHAAIYDERGRDVLAELADAIEDAKGVMGGSDLKAAAETLNKIMGEIDQGKGTIGALIKDPTVYQDLKQLLGEVRRNVILKSIVRMTIAKDDLDRK
jgi:phospholipid/cholesterol/gamma-HCH transport system substrate-binding protein